MWGGGGGDSLCSEWSLYCNPFPALTTLSDIHGKVFPHLPGQRHRMSCPNSNCSCMLRYRPNSEKKKIISG